MDIQIRRFGNYKEVTYTDINVKCESGLLDVVEQKQLGLALLQAAHDVLPALDNDERLHELIETFAVEKVECESK